MSLRWSRVDLARGQLILNETKNDTSRAIPLAGLALQLMTGLAKVRRIDTDLVFYGNDTTKSMDLTRLWGTAMRKAGLENFGYV